MLKSFKLPFVFAFIKTLSANKIANGLQLRCSYYLSQILGKQIIWGKPESIAVEPTNLCNLKCPECPSGNNSLNRPRLFLSLQTYKTFINENKKHLTYLQLYFQGEPFLHPKIYEFISYAVARNIFVTTSTNGHFLTPNNCKKLVESGLQQLIISIDGTSQEIYEKYRIGGSLDLVLRGIEDLQKAKKQAGKHLPHVVIQFVVFKQNEHQIAEIRELGKQFNVNDVRLKSAQIDDFENGNDLMPDNEKYNRYKKNENGTYELKRKSNFKCFRIWSGSVISAEGDVLPCCFDKEAKYSYGSLKENSLQHLWKGSESRNFKAKVWTDFKQFDICKNCTEGLGRTWF